MTSFSKAKHKEYKKVMAVNLVLHQMIPSNILKLKQPEIPKAECMPSIAQVSDVALKSILYLFGRFR